MVFPGAAPASSGTSDRCRGARTDTLVESSVVRVYQTRATRRSEARSFACNRRTGRRLGIDRPASVDPTFVATDRHLPKIAGWYVAFVLGLGAEADAEALRVIDTRTGKQLRVDSWGDEGELYDFHLRPTGAVAWSDTTDELGQDTRPATIFGQIKLRVPGRGVQLLDSAADVDPASLAVSGDARLIFWVSGGEARVAPFR
jgi:hypothetical protein